MEMVAIIDQRHRKRKHMQEMSVLDSVIAILIEILSRVPGSFLSRLRFVCKLWHTVITHDPLLAELHLLRGFGSTSPSIVVLCQNARHSTYYLTLMDGAGGCQRDVLDMGEIHTRISSSCNGLLCIYDRMNRVSIFNPTTRQEFVLPPTNAESHKAFKQCYLGYIATTNEYKVLSCTQPRSSILTTCEVITVGTNLWRQIASPNFDQPNWNAVATGSMWKGVVINEFVYCMVRTLEHLQRKGQILSFDFNSEKFQTIKFPRFVSDLDSLLELEGRLCVASRTGSGSMEIWMLEDITNHDWICRYTLRISPTRFVYQPVFIHQGKILIKSLEDLFYQDLKTGEDSEVIYHDPRMLETQGHIEGLFFFRDLVF